MAACLLLAACGGDDEPKAETAPATVPDLSLPETEKAEPPAPTTETTPTPPPQTETTPPSDNGGTTAPQPAPPADSPQNDTPPPTDSPAERFEQFCNDNPGACG